MNIIKGMDRIAIVAAILIGISFLGGFVVALIGICLFAPWIKKVGLWIIDGFKDKKKLRK